MVISLLCIGASRIILLWMIPTALAMGTIGTMVLRLVISVLSICLNILGGVNGWVVLRTSMNRALVLSIFRLRCIDVLWDVFLVMICIFLGTMFADIRLLVCFGGVIIMIRLTWLIRSMACR